MVLAVLAGAPALETPKIGKRSLETATALGAGVSACEYDTCALQGPLPAI